MEMYTKYKSEENVMFLEKLKNQLNESQPLFIGEDSAQRFAVILPIVQVDRQWHLLFEVRSFKMRKQPGDISFPGGRIDDSDSTPLAAALREMSEELGVNPDKVTVLGQLSPFVASPTFVIYPFIATFEYEEILEFYNLEEVEEIFTVPIHWLLNYEPYMHLVSVEPTPGPDFPYHKIYNGDQYKWRVRYMEEWFFDYGKYTIWGLTARILKHFIERIK